MASMADKKCALIAGGAGFIGSYIARHFLESGIVEKVVLLDHFGRYVDSMRSGFVDYRQLRLQGLSERVVVERGDAKYYSVVAHVMETHRPDFVLQMAALPLAKLPNLNSEEAREGSIDSTAIMLDAMSQLMRRTDYRPSRFVYASSSMVYGDFQSAEATEEHPTNPKEIYGTMKLAGEVVTRGLAGFVGIPYSIVRPSAVYGPTDMNRRVTQIFIEKAFRGETLSVQGADEKLDFSHVRDVARGFVLAATRPEAQGETFNITHGKAHTLIEFVQCLARHFPGLRYEVTERDQFRPLRSTLSIAKATRLLGYRPQYTLDRGIEEYVAFIREHNPRLASGKDAG
jgi:UDP-glucose 4-epimerase